MNIVNSTKSSIRSHQVFISYSSKDKVVADGAKHALEAQGIRCWKAPDDILPGDDWAESIADIIPKVKAMVLIWSEASQDSKEVKKELTLAMRSGVTLIPFRIEDIQPKGAFGYHFANLHWLDAFDVPHEIAFSALVNRVSPALGIFEQEPREDEKEIAKSADTSVFPFDDSSHPVFSENLPQWKDELWEKTPPIANLWWIALESKGRKMGISHTEMENAKQYFDANHNMVAFQECFAEALSSDFCQETADALEVARHKYCIHTDKLKHWVPVFISENYPDKIFPTSDSSYPKWIQLFLHANEKDIPVEMNEVEVENSASEAADLADSEQLYKMAMEKFEVESYTEALEYINSSLKKDPGMIRAYNLRGLIKSDLGDQQGALEDYSKAIELDPTFAVAYYNRGFPKRELGDQQGALKDYSKAIELDPSNVDGYNFRGSTKHDLGDHQGALEDYSKAIELDPTDAFSYNRRGCTKDILGDQQGALKDYSKAIELDPTYAVAYNNRGNTKGDLGDHQGALEDYNKAIELDPTDAFSYNIRGFTKSKLGDQQGALEDYSKAIELDPTDAETYKNRGLTKGDLGDHQGALEDYNKAIELDPTDAETYIDLGLTKGELGDHQGALKDYNKAIKLDPTDALAYTARGTTKVALGDHHGALKDYSKAIGLDPTCARNYNIRGFTKSKLGDHQGALEDYIKAIELDPTDADFAKDRNALVKKLENKKSWWGR